MAPTHPLWPEARFHTALIRETYLKESDGPLALYAELARDYVELWETNERKPTAALAARRGVEPELMRSHIHLARKNGFLTETGRGKAGGALTPKAQRALAKKAPAAIGRKKR